MQGVTTFAILVLFVAQSYNAEIVQPCRLVKDGNLEGKVSAEEGSIPMQEGAKLRILSDADDNNVTGSSLLFCDDQIDDVVIELADDNSYLVSRPIDSDNDSYYVIKLVSADDPPAPALAYAAYRPTNQLKRKRS